MHGAQDFAQQIGRQMAERNVYLHVGCGLQVAKTVDCTLNSSNPIQSCETTFPETAFHTFYQQPRVDCTLIVSSFQFPVSSYHLSIEQRTKVPFRNVSLRGSYLYKFLA